MFPPRTRFLVVILVLALLLLSAAIGALPALAGWSQGYTGEWRAYLPLKFGNVRPTPGFLLITEVLYDPLTEEPDGEWVEVYNPGSSPLPLAGYKIGDEETLGGGEGMYRFPAGAELGGGQVVVIAGRAEVFASTYGFAPDYEFRESDPDVPTLQKYTAWAGGNVELVNTSDEMLVLDADNALVDAVSWGASIFAFDPPAPDVDDGHSLERVPAHLDADSASDWRAQASPDPGKVDLEPLTPTPTASATATISPGLTATPTPSETATPGPSPTATASPTPFGDLLLISEVSYDPVGEEPDGEWVEVYNATGAAVALSGFKIGDEETQGGGEGMYRFPQGATVEAGEVVIIAHRSATFEAAFGFQADFELTDTDPDVPVLDKVSEWAAGTMSLGNTGDEVLLLDGGNHLVDALSWGSSDFAFDPPAEDVAEGHSLERRPADVDSDTAGDWVDQPAPDPGAVNLTPLPPTETLTPGPGSTPTITPTPSGTPAVTSTASPFPSPTLGPSPTPAATRTPTPELSATPSPTPSPTIEEPTPTGSPSPPGSTESPTPTPVASGTPAPSASPTLTDTPGAGEILLIAEVFYDTPGTDSQEEWVELYHASGGVVDLSGYKLGDEEVAGGSEGMFRFPDGATMAPGERVVIALRGTGFAGLYGFPPDYEVVDTDPLVPDMLPYPDWSSGAWALGNSGDEVVLLDGQDVVVDVVTYESGVYPGVLPHPGVPTGHSLERSPPGQDTDDCSVDFIDQPEPTPGG